MPAMRLARMVGVTLFVLALASCAARTEIGHILADPRAYEGKTITVEGEVTDVFSLFVIKYFRLDDGTGAIGVVSDKPLPRKGQRLKVTGQIREAFSLGDTKLTVLLENASAMGR